MRQYLYLIINDQIGGPIPAFLRFFLKGLSFIYAFFVKVIAAGYEKGIFRRYELGRPVISVGNITWGGVGKTPLVLFIAEYLRKKNIHPVILTRGYMAADPSLKDLPKSDEVTMLQAALPDVPIIIHKNRIKGAQYALLHHKVDVFLLDDGFQQWRIFKDWDIVVVDATNPFGNGSLLPHGILREPLSALARADVLVTTKSDLGQNNIEKIKDTLKKIKPQTPVLETIHQPVKFENMADKKSREVSSFKDQDVAILCSIGDPKSFEGTIFSLGARVKKKFFFPDHHNYDAVNIAKILHECHAEKILVLLTTAKDEVKLKAFSELWQNNLEIYVLKINLTFLKGQDAFFHRIDSVFFR